MNTTDVPCRLSAAQHDEQVLRLLRRSARPVGSSSTRIFAPRIQRAQDLHALLRADADVLDLRVRVDGEAERRDSSRTRARRAAL